MKKFIFLISLFFLVAVFITPSFSSSCGTGTGKGKGHDYSGHFGDMDVDGNDQVNWDEFKNHFEHAKEKTFKGIDENGDGSIDHDEWHDFKANHGHGHKHKE